MRGLGELRPPPPTRAWTPARGQPPGRRLPGARCSCRLLGRCGPRTPVRPLFPGGREHLMQTFSPFSAHISGPALWPPFKRLPLRPLKSTGRRSQRLGSRAPRRGRPAGSGFPSPNAAIAAANLRASPPSLVSPPILLAPPPLRLTARVAWTPPPATPGPTVILAHAGGRGSQTAWESPGSPGSPGQPTHLAPCHARPMPGETQLAFALHLRGRFSVPGDRGLPQATAVWERGARHCPSGERGPCHAPKPSSEWRPRRLCPPGPADRAA